MNFRQTLIMLHPRFLLISIILPMFVHCEIDQFLTKNLTNNETQIKMAEEVEIMMKLEKVRLRSLFIKELGLPNHPVARKTSKKLPESVVEKLLSEDVTPRRPPKLAEILIPPSNVDVECRKQNSTSCRRFEYTVSSDTFYYNTKLCLFKLKSVPNEQRTISVLCSHPEDFTEELVEEDTLYIEDKDDHWHFYNLTFLKQMRYWKGDLTCSIEISGMIIGEEPHNQPHLKVVQDLDAHSREKRASNKTNKSQSCWLIPFNISFHEIGLDSYIVHPKSFQANLCRGYCLEAQTMHETLLEYAFLANSTLEKEHGRCWATCCRPKSFESLQIIYEEEVKNGTESLIKFVHTNMINIVVTDCWCN